MALSQVYTAVAGHTITADRWNNEWGNVLNNGTDLAFPLTKAVSFAGYTITWDASGNTTMISSASQSLQYTPGAKTGTPSTTGSVLNVVASTYTDNNTAGSGTATAWAGVTIQRPTLAATNASVVTTDAATLYIANSPAEGTNETITNEYALWIDDGRMRTDLTSSIPSAAGATCRALYLPAATQTITGSTNITTASGYNFVEIERPVMSAGTALTITNAATLYIENAPNSGGAGPSTITNPYALWVNEGRVRFDEAVEVRGVASATPVANTLYADTIIKGWVETSGGASPVIDADVNVSSITDNNPGDFTINWATAFSSGDYAVVGVTIQAATARHLCELTSTAKTASLVRVGTVESGVGLSDPNTGISVIAVGAQ